MTSRTVHGFTVPSIHLNGTGATTLRDEYAAAYEALDKAVEAFVSTTCNARFRGRGLRSGPCWYIFLPGGDASVLSD